jgi:hypothetical protein
VHACIILPTRARQKKDEVTSHQHCAFTNHSSLAVSAVRPVISLNGTQNATYLVALVDLSLPVANARSTTNATLVAGLGSNRTTRLHWLQTGIRQSTNGSFTWNATALAPYGK